MKKQIVFMLIFLSVPWVFAQSMVSYQAQLVSMNDAQNMLQGIQLDQVHMNTGGSWGMHHGSMYSDINSHYLYGDQKTVNFFNLGSGKTCFGTGALETCYD